MTDQQALSRVLRQFARAMANTYDVVEALHGLSENVVDVLEATDAGVGLYDQGRLRFVTATSDAAAEAERLQERLQPGACVEAIHLDAPVAVSDLREHHGRWPEYAPRLQAERPGITPEDAFQRTRATARSRSTKIVTICRRMIDYTPD